MARAARRAGGLERDPAFEQQIAAQRFWAGRDRRQGRGRGCAAGESGGLGAIVRDGMLMEPVQIVLSQPGARLKRPSGPPQNH